MALDGPIASAARRQLPVTWDALSQDGRFADAADFEDTIGYVSERLFGRDLTLAEEGALPRFVVQYAGKLVALELIAPGIDMWMNLSLQETTRSPDENVLYANRAAELRELRKLLLEQTRADESQALQLITGFRGLARRAGVPRTNTLNDDFLTPSHQEFPRPFRPTART